MSAGTAQSYFGFHTYFDEKTVTYLLGYATIISHLHYMEIKTTVLGALRAGGHSEKKPQVREEVRSSE